MSSPPEARSPLENTTNGLNASPRGATAKTGPVLRRKPSNRALHPWLDSSESYPSPHSSIYEASLVDTITEHVSWHNAKDWTTPSAPAQGSSSWPNNGPTSWENTVLDSSGNAVPASFLQATPSPKTHTPHKLFPITEQNSLATLKTHPSASSTRPLSPGLHGKKQKSFSTSDLPRAPSPPPSPHPPYHPLEPHHPPPLRIPTPPTLPTFNTPAATAYRLPPPTVRFRDRFRSPTPAEREWSMQTVGLPRGVVMRGENGVLVRGKFTPIRSGHFPPQRQRHAVMRVGEGGGRGRERAVTERERERAVVIERPVRFSGPRLRPRGNVGGEGVLAEAATGGGTLSEKKNRGRAERVLERFYWVVGCCGGCERWEASAERGSGSQRGFEGGGGVGETPLFVGGFHAAER